MLQSKITLHPAVLADSLPIAQLHNAAFANDDLLETMYGPLTQNDTPFANDLQKIIADDPYSRITKAIDTASGQIVAWSWWSLYPDAEAHATAAEEARKRGTNPPAASLCPRLYLDYQDLKARMREKWIGGRPVASKLASLLQCLIWVLGLRLIAWVVLQVLAVHPDYQGRGIGTQLLMVGVEEARRLGLPAWLEASEAGYSVYRRCGFVDAERMELDFGKYGLSGMEQVYCMLMDDVEQSSASTVDK
jgi:GNAT superfamily N-acetyltransferase